MFSKFGKSQERSESLNLFNENDIREILGSFSLDDGEKTLESENLILSSSKVGVIRKDELVEDIKDKVHNGQGLLSIESLAEEYEIDQTVLHGLLAKKDGIFLSEDDRNILTRKGQDDVISLVFKITSESFQPTSKLSGKCGVRTETLLELLQSRRNDSLLKDQGLVFDQAVSFVVFKNSGVIVYSSLLLEKVKTNVRESIHDAQKSSNPVSWSTTTFHDLSGSQFLKLAKEISKDLIGSSPGTFLLDNQVVIFTPKEHLVKDRNQKLESISSGNVPYLDLKDMIGSLPSQFPHLEAALEFVEEKYPKVSVSQTIMLSNEWIHRQLDEDVVEANKSGHVELTEIFSLFPKASTPTINMLIATRLDTHPDVERVGDYLVTHSWVSNFETQAQDLATNLAESIWEKEEQTRPKSSAINSQLKDLLIQKGKLEKNLVEALWAAKDGHFATHAVSSFDTKLEELDVSSDEQFNTLWSSRVVSKIQLFEKGLSEISDQALRDQLMDLLKTHISKELVPLAINRAKTKGFLRSPRRKLTSRIAKLQTSLSSKKDYSATTEELAKFNSQMDILQPTEDQLDKEKMTYAKDMIKTMSKDDDGARLFLCLLLVLFSSFHDGMLYATGKFAPKILKSLKPRLSPDDSQWLDQVKDSIKAGNTTDEMKQQMRSMGSHNV